MRKHSFGLIVVVIAFSFGFQLLAQQVAPAAQPEVKALPAAMKSGGMTLTEALATRRSIRTFTPAPLTDKELGQLLWAAQGVTDTRGHRTAPSARAQYYLHVYLATAEGLFAYDPAKHELRRLAAQDLRAALSSQGTVRQAPAVLLITGEYARAVQQSSQDTGLRWVNLEAGHAAQNVLLQATALGLGAVPVGGVDPKQIAEAAPIPKEHTPIYLIPVGRTK